MPTGPGDGPKPVYDFLEVPMVARLLKEYGSPSAVAVVMNVKHYSRSTTIKIPDSIGPPRPSSWLPTSGSSRC